MKLASLLLASLLLTGCAPLLGAHVHRFQYQGVDYVKCTVIAEAGKSQLAEPAIDICRDAVREHARH